jgi:hypothetical protein
MTLTQYATATQGSEVYVPAEYPDGSPTGAPRGTVGTVSAHVACGFLSVSWGLLPTHEGTFEAYALRARCWMCKADLGDDKAHNGRFHISCGKASDRDERNQRRIDAADVEETDRRGGFFGSPSEHERTRNMARAFAGYERNDPNYEED